MTIFKLKKKEEEIKQFVIKVENKNLIDKSKEKRKLSYRYWH